ncbi:hypothetical protein GF325_07060 [Candidatus Bathyarchaeota archaeon]|nr:hypothetical protein [Candidatus Bathyarchaeota archaeon]
MSSGRNRIKITIFGARHTGQGPLSRAWGRTSADLPALQPACIYERVVSIDGKKATVAAWVLSLHPRFDYMRKSMYSKSDGFIYTFDARSQPEASLRYLEPFLDEVKLVLEDAIPCQVLVGSAMDPTLPRPLYLDDAVSNFMKKNGRMDFMEIDLTNKDEFFSMVDDIFKHLLKSITGAMPSLGR